MASLKVHAIIQTCIVILLGIIIRSSIIFSIYSPHVLVDFALPYQEKNSDLEIGWLALGKSRLVFSEELP